MKTSLRIRFLFSVAVVGMIALSSGSLRAQSQFFVTKAQVFIQTSSAGPVADPTAPFVFSAKAGSNVTFTLPGGSTVTIPAATNGDQPFQLGQSFSTKAALDAAFPNGTYKMTTASNTTFNLNLSTDSYPSVTPQVTGGTWNAGGLLVVNPTQNVTITFNTFTGYATSGTFGHMSTNLSGLTDNVDISNDVITAANPFGLTTTSTPLTTLTIPAGRLTNGRVYQAEIDFDTGTTFDLTTASGSAGIALYSKRLSFYIAAATTGDGGAAPTIIAQPTNQSGSLGGSATFNLGVTLTNNPSILWNFNGQQLNIDGNKYAFVSGANLTIRNLTAADAGTYTATIISTGGIVTTSAATLTVNAPPPPAAPTITRQSAAKNVATGSTVVFSVSATGPPAPNFQWRKDGSPISNGVNGYSGTNSSTLVITTGANATTVGNYSVVVSNASGTVTSDLAALTVVPTTDPTRLTNLSVLTDVSAGSNFTVATVVGPPGASGTKPLVVRVVGPSLAAITGSSAGLLPAPKLDLFLGTSNIASNSGWAGNPTVGTAMASVGAFAFLSPTSTDAAVYQPSLTSGSYSVIASGVGNASGLAIAEIYDAAATGSPNAASPRLVNVSVLKQIASGGSLTLGFTLGPQGGPIAKTVLIRVIGPGLAAILGSTAGTLTDPQLTLFNTANQIIATNDDWGADPQLSTAGTRVGAFNIGPNASKDSMLLITLPTGGYTARATGNNGTSGNAIVEVYEVP